MSDRQVLERALATHLSLCFLFEGLAIDVNDGWLREGGATHFRVGRDLHELEQEIAAAEAHITRSRLHQCGPFEQELTPSEMAAVRALVEEKRRSALELRKRLEQREVDRQRMVFAGHLRAGPQTVAEMLRTGKAEFPILAFDPQVPCRIGVVDGQTVLDGRLLALEPEARGASWPQHLLVQHLVVNARDVISAEANLAPRVEVNPSAQEPMQLSAQQAAAEIAAPEAGEPARRLRRLLELGGRVKYERNGDVKTFVGFNKLVRAEVGEGRARSSTKIIRKDLTEAAMADVEARRAGTSTVNTVFALAGALHGSKN